MTIRIATLAIVMSLFITTVPAFSHHSDVAYQRTSIELKTATIVKVAWINPHAVVACDVKDTTGKVSRWTLEMGSPSAMTRVGWEFSFAVQFHAAFEAFFKSIFRSDTAIVCEGR